MYWTDYQQLTPLFMLGKYASSYNGTLLDGFQ